MRRLLVSEDITGRAARAADRLSRIGASAPWNGYSAAMLKLRTKRLARRNEEATRRLTEIQLSITALSDDDLLDLGDIFQAEPRGALGEIAWAEMERRNISL